MSGFTHDVTHDTVNHTLLVHGSDFGYGYKPMPVHWRSGLGRGDVVVCKIPGHKRWDDLLHPSVYKPAHFLVFRLERTDGGKMGAEQLAWFPLKAGLEEN